MKAQNPSTSLGEGRDTAPSLAHPSQKQNLVVYTEDLTHLAGPLNWFASAALVRLISELRLASKYVDLKNTKRFTLVACA